MVRRFCLRRDSGGACGFYAALCGGGEPDRRDGSKWESQLHAVDGAQDLVTVSLGVNDMKWDQPFFWIRESLKGNTERSADALLTELNAPRGNSPSYMDELFGVLKRADERGAEVVVNLYYNPVHAPYEIQTLNGPMTKCSATHGIAKTITGKLNDQLQQRATNNGLLYADFEAKFVENGEDHGAGGPDPGESWVYGTGCDVDDAILGALPDSFNPFGDDFLGGSGYQGIAEKFDPHPNPSGSRAMAEEIQEVIR